MTDDMGYHAARVLYLPTMHLRGGGLVRRAEFSTADPAFRGSLADAVEFFVAQAGLVAFHLVVEDDPLAPSNLDAIAEARASGAVTLLLEGPAVADTSVCARLAARALAPVATPALARDPALTAAWRTAQPQTIYLATAAEADDLADLLSAMLPAGMPPLLYRPSDPAEASHVFHTLRPALPSGLTFVVASPPVVPTEASILAQMSFNRRIYRDGLPAIAVDAEWFIDYHLT